MRRVWAAVLAVWALFALVAVLAWTRTPLPRSQAAPTRIVVKTPGGGLRTVIVRNAPHATTQTSPPSAAPQRQLAAATGATGRTVSMRTSIVTPNNGN